jgi:putative peptidoglycan lipid II flippase
MRRAASAARLLTAITLLSRILGYGRDMLIAWIFGTGLFTDAFIAAFRIPNVLRRLFGEGALGMGFIPIYSACLRREGPAAAHRLAASAVQMMVVMLVPVVILGAVGSPWVVRLIAPGYAVGSPVYALAVELTRIMWPYVFFAGVVAMIAGVLNAQGHFAAPALAPVGLNLVLIFTLLTTAGLSMTTAIGIKALAVGVVVAGGVQLLIQLPALKARRIALWHPVWPPHPELGAVGRMAVPAALGSASFQFNIVIGTLLASFLAPGSISSLFFADRLIQFPLGLFAVSASTALLPGLSRLAAGADWPHFVATFQKALRLVWFVTLPAMTGLVVLRMPIVQVLLERGAFGSNSTRLTSEAVLCYGTGLWAYAGLRIVQTAFYALKDARTPLAVAAVGMAFNLVVGAGLMHPLGHKGIALAAAGAAATSLGLLLIALRRKIGNLGGKAITLAFIRAGCCSILMGIMVTALLHWLPIDPQAGLAVNGVRLLVCVTAGLAGYLALSWLTNSRELQMLYRFVRHRDLPP